MGSSAWVWVGAVSAALACWWLVPPPSVARLAPDPVGEAVRRWLARVPAWLSALPRRRDERRAEAVRASVPSVCDLLAVCLDAGRQPRSALRVVADVARGPVVDELRGVLARIDLGVDEADAWAGLARAPGYREVARDLARSVRSGLGLAALLRRHAVDARKERAGEALVLARAAGVKSVVPLMVCFLPAFMLLGIVPIFGSLAGRLLP